MCLSIIGKFLKTKMYDIIKGNKNVCHLCDLFFFLERGFRFKCFKVDGGR